MKRTHLFQGLAVLAAACTISCVPQFHRQLDTEARTVPGGREVKVSVAQAEIKADIHVSTGGMAFGLVGALVDASVNNSRATDAEKRVQVVRESLAGFDFDTMAWNRTRETMTRLAWFGAKDTSFAKDNSIANRIQQLDQAKTAQVLFADYSYSLSPDFSSIRVSLTASLAKQATEAGQAAKDRLAAKNLLYTQRFIHELPLLSPSQVPEENAQRWAADGGKLARKALDTGLAQVQRLLEQSVTQSPEAAKAIDKAETINLGTWHGQLIAKSDQGTLLRAPFGVWVYVSGQGL